MSEPAEQAKPRIFLSYSRKDTPFVDELVISVESYGFDVVIDRADLFPGEPWEPRLQRLISDAETTVAIVSQNWIASAECIKEASLALGQGRRVIPVVIDPVNPASMPQDLARLQFIFFERGKPTYSYARSVVSLIEALRTDIGWVREQSRLLDKADEWLSQARSPMLLLRGVALQRALDWAGSTKPRDTRILPLVSDYIETSRGGQDLEEKKRLKDRARFAFVSFAAAFFALIGAVAVGSLFYVQWQHGKDVLARTGAEVAARAELDELRAVAAPAPGRQPASVNESTIPADPSAPDVPPSQGVPPPQPRPDAASTRQLVLDLNSKDKATRLRAGQQVAELVRAPGNGPLLSALVDQLELPRLEELSAAGRVNVLYMLDEYDGWRTSPEATDLRNALRTIDERAARLDRPMVVGCQTRDYIISLRNKLGDDPGPSCGG